MSSQQEIKEEGQHLDAIRLTLAGCGLALTTLSAEIAVHVGEDAGRAAYEFAANILKPVVENLDAQLDELEQQYHAAEAEAGELESWLQLPDAEKPSKGVGGYL